jgi:LysM repeat protein
VPTVSVPPSPSVAPVPTDAPSAAPLQAYIVKRGDTLTSIAGRYGVTIARLKRANGIDDPNLIIVGQTLQIPER